MLSLCASCRGLTLREIACARIPALQLPSLAPESKAVQETTPARKLSRELGKRLFVLAFERARWIDKLAHSISESKTIVLLMSEPIPPKPGLRAVSDGARSCCRFVRKRPPGRSGSAGAILVFVRPYRVVLAVVPYLVVLVALAVAGQWWWFGVATVATVATYGASIALALRANRRAKGGKPLTGKEFGAWVERWAWLIALVLALLGTAAFFPSFRRQAWWTLPLYTILLFIVFWGAARQSGRWSKRYEEEFERFTGRGRRS